MTMNIKRKKGWEIPESAATPEAAFFARRRTVLGGIAGVAALGAGAYWMLSGRGADAPMPAEAAAATPPAADPSADLYPAMRNMRYRLDRAVTQESLATTYNNFYEFGSSNIDDLLKPMKLEERLYRHRCVEAWAMAVPWTGFPMKDFVEFAAPLSSAKYVRMETFMDAAMAPGQKAGWYPWPYDHR
jgi:methionine sulfoxide reductase catalytic subunit